MKIPAAIALSCLLLAQPALADQASDDVAITRAVDSWYLGRILSRVAWDDGVVITEIFPYAMFDAGQGNISIDTLVKNVDGTWHVVLPSKGIVEPDMLTSLGLTLQTAQALLQECTRSYRPPYFTIGHGYRRVRVIRGRIPAMSVTPVAGKRSTDAVIVPSFAFYGCSS